MTTSCFYTKCLKSTWLKSCSFVHEISNLAEVFYEKGVLKSFSKFRGKHKMQSSSRGVPSERCSLKFTRILWSLFLIKMGRPATLLERDSNAGVSAFCEFCKVFRTFLQITSWQPMMLRFSFSQINEVCSLKKFEGATLHYEKEFQTCQIFYWHRNSPGFDRFFQVSRLFKIFFLALPATSVEKRNFPEFFGALFNGYFWNCLTKYISD